MASVREYVRGCVQVWEGVHGCARVCAGVGGSAWVCVGVRGCARVCAGVRGCARVCTGVRGYGMYFQNFFWRIESLHQRTLMRFLYEFLFWVLNLNEQL